MTDSSEESKRAIDRLAEWGESKDKERQQEQEEEEEEEQEHQQEQDPVRLPEDLLNEFRHLAIDRKTTVTELLIAAMKQYLKASKK